MDKETRFDLKLGKTWDLIHTSWEKENNLDKTFIF